jgi:uncharacterized protein YihD (DUF1040 family)
MRDPRRIEEILGLISEIWKKDPDLRFQQLIYNLQWEFSYRNAGLGKVEESELDGFKRTGFDLFNVEDDVFVEYLKTHLGGNE